MTRTARTRPRPPVPFRVGTHIQHNHPVIRGLLNLVAPSALLIVALAVFTVAAEVRQGRASSLGAAGQDARADLNAAFTALNEGDIARAGRASGASRGCRRARTAIHLSVRSLPHRSGGMGVGRCPLRGPSARRSQLRTCVVTSQRRLRAVRTRPARRGRASFLRSSGAAGPRARRQDVPQFNPQSPCQGRSARCFAANWGGLLLFPADPSLWDAKSWCLKLAGQHEEARSAARHAGTLWDASASKTIPPDYSLAAAGRVYVLQGPGGAFSHENLNSRFAWNLQTVDVQARTFLTDGRTNEDFPSFGATVRAIADGVIVQSHDGVEDHGPGAPNARAARGTTSPSLTAGSTRLCSTSNVGRFWSNEVTA